MQTEAQTAQVSLRGAKLIKRSVDNTKTNYFVMLDMVGYTSAKKLYIQFGKTLYASDIANTSGQFVQTGNVVSINYQGKDYPICAESMGVLLDIPKSYFPDLKNMTIYIEDKTGKLSNKIDVESF